MKSRKKPRSGIQAKRTTQGSGVRGKEEERGELVGAARGRKKREDATAEVGRPAESVGGGATGERILVHRGGGEAIEKRGAQPALPTPIATFTI